MVTMDLPMSMLLYDIAKGLQWRIGVYIVYIRFQVLDVVSARNCLLIVLLV